MEVMKHKNWVSTMALKRGKNRGGPTKYDLCPPKIKTSKIELFCPIRILSFLWV